MFELWKRKPIAAKNWSGVEQNTGLSDFTTIRLKNECQESAFTRFRNARRSYRVSCGNGRISHTAAGRTKLQCHSCWRPLLPNRLLPSLRHHHYHTRLTAVAVAASYILPVPRLLPDLIQRFNCWLEKKRRRCDERRCCWPFNIPNLIPLLVELKGVSFPLIFRIIAHETLRAVAMRSVL